MLEAMEAEMEAVAATEAEEMVVAAVVGHRCIGKRSLPQTPQRE